ncbi:hypothetical protein OS493_023010 [Desmophyllum pertusum]|uniref:Uncharacterized protein n=1 Tax=Desmophyllum pertusum TaxID=174260 RepID=A0A9W9ZBS9_9CNID|nr:hypothetical protein OS493_023010 [Desmophyllum pertusum]
MTARKVPSFGKASMYDGNEKCLITKSDVNMAAMFIRSRAVAFLLLNICNCSLTTLLEAVTRLLTDCSRFYPYADHNIADNLIVRLEVAVCRCRLVDLQLLDRGDQANDERISHLKSLVIGAAETSGRGLIWGVLRCMKLRLLQTFSIYLIRFEAVSPGIQDVIFSRQSLDHLCPTNQPNDEQSATSRRTINFSAMLRSALG